MNTLTVTTDYGNSDWYVASIKGIIMGINPRVGITDITHQIPAGNIQAGAFVLAATYRFFPLHTVHLAIVDPGVGSARDAIAVHTKDYFFVAPDNGLLSLALAKESIIEIRRIENEAYFRKPVCSTFHGRDIFAPVAAHLTQGLELRVLGKKLTDYKKVHLPELKFDRDQVHGEIVYIDHFGNAITNIDQETLSRFGKRSLEVSVSQTVKCKLLTFYEEVKPNQPLGVMGSSGYLEIALNAGNATSELQLNIGDPVLVAEQTMQ